MTGSHGSKQIPEHLFSSVPIREIRGLVFLPLLFDKGAAEARVVSLLQEFDRLGNISRRAVQQMIVHAFHISVEEIANSNASDLSWNHERHETHERRID